MPESNWDVGMDIIREEVRSWIAGPTISNDDLSSLRSGLTYAQHAMAAAEHVAEFRQAEGAVTRLQQARRAIGVISTALDGIQIYRSIDAIRLGVRDLHRIGNVSSDPAASAVAFGQILSACGELCGHLPPPANAYGDLLSQSGSFFTNMLSGLDPAQRWHHRPDGRAVDLSRPPVF